jgi:deazaflavin-dependent oxidoreductase (nitroreductase family)
MSAAEARRAPNPLFRRAIGAPALLYRIGAGRLLGHRFLLLTHRGRRSDRVYRTILEVVDWDVARREAIVMSGLGPWAGWYLNVLDGGAEEVRIAAARFRPAVRELETDEAVRVVAGYERRNRFVAPVVRAIFSRLAGFRYDGSEEARRRLVGALPLLAFRESSAA